jgi:K+-sensing histidine kinase KdpD
MERPIIDFATVLASSAHDMKNSLSLLIQLISQLSDKMRLNNMDEAEDLAQIHYEASRLNINLLHMLTIYREEKDVLPLNIDDYYLDETLEDLVAQNTLYIDNKHLSITFDIEDQLSWYFDQDLVSSLLNDVLVNSMRYSNKSIVLSAKKVNEQLHISIADDGTGYPAHMLESSISGPQAIELNISRTGLGLYFAQLIAAKHEQNGVSGYIKLKNGGVLNGSVFTLVLP